MEINLFFHKYNIEENVHMNEQDIQKILANIGSSVVRGLFKVYFVWVLCYSF